MNDVKQVSLKKYRYTYGQALVLYIGIQYNTLGTHK